MAASAGQGRHRGGSGGAAGGVGWGAHALCSTQVSAMLVVQARRKHVLYLPTCTRGAHAHITLRPRMHAFMLGAQPPEAAQRKRLLSHHFASLQPVGSLWAPTCITAAYSPSGLKMSERETRPTGRPALSTTGRRRMFFASMRSAASCTEVLGVMVKAGLQGIGKSHSAQESRRSSWGGQCVCHEA